MPTPPAWNVTWPVKKTPVFATIVQTPASGVAELRLALYRYPRWQFELDVSYLKGDLQTPTSALATVAAFYVAMQGAGQDWLYLDPFDNTVTTMPFGTGDGVTTQFQLTRGNGLDLIQNVNGAIAVFLNGVPTYTYGVSATGVVIFATAPPAGVTLTWTGSFFYRCRFLEDSLPELQETLYQIWELHSLKFLSVILPTNLAIVPPVGTTWRIGVSGYSELGFTTVLN